MECPLLLADAHGYGNTAARGPPRHPLGSAPMKRHHVQLAWEGAGQFSARCRCGWSGDRRVGDGAWWAAERDAKAHEQAVREGRQPNHGQTKEDRS